MKPNDILHLWRLIVVVNNVRVDVSRALHYYGLTVATAKRSPATRADRTFQHRPLSPGKRSDKKTDSCCAPSDPPMLELTALHTARFCKPHTRQPIPWKPPPRPILWEPPSPAYPLGAPLPGLSFGSPPPRPILWEPPPRPILWEPPPRPILWEPPPRPSPGGRLDAGGRGKQNSALRGKRTAKAPPANLALCAVLMTVRGTRAVMGV